MKASVSMYCVPVLLKYYTGTIAAGSASPPPVRMLSIDALKFHEVLSNGTSPPFWSMTSYA